MTLALLFKGALFWYHDRMSGEWELFLDDLREPNYVGIDLSTHPREVVVARDYAQAVKALMTHDIFPSHIYFDNDLGYPDLEGYDFAKELVRMHLDSEIVIPVEFSYSVHSSNPPAKQNIISYLDGFRKFLQEGQNV